MGDFVGGEIAKVHALALVGMAGAGKSLCARILSELGYPFFRFGSIVIAEIERRGMAVTPQNERAIREELRTAEGMTVIAKRALPRLQDILHQNGCVVMDGLYGQGEYLFLRQELDEDLVLLAIVAPRRLRYQRLANRSERLLSAEEAEQRDLLEIDALEKGGPIAFADYTIVNDGSEDRITIQTGTCHSRVRFRNKRKARSQIMTTGKFINGQEMVRQFPR